MKKTYLLGMVICLLILGAGCNNQEETNNTKPANDQTTSSTVLNPTENIDITLTAETTGNRTVNLEWQTSEANKKIADGYGLTWGRELNPTYPGKYWYQRGPAHFELTWYNLPTGEGHIRLCIIQKGVCTLYSNDVAVNIQ